MIINMSSDKSKVQNEKTDLSSTLQKRTRGETVIAVFDVGKTNKKLFLFDEHYKILSEESTRFEETKDEDGFPCEDLQALTKWTWEKFWQISSHPDYNLRTVNFS